MDWKLFFNEEFIGLLNKTPIQHTVDIVTEYTEAIENHKRWDNYPAHTFGDHPKDKPEFMADSQQNIDRIIKQLDITFLN